LTVISFALFSFTSTIAPAHERLRGVSLWSGLIFTKSKVNTMKLRLLAFPALWLALLAGCAGGGIGGIAGAALDATGLRKPPELPDAQKPPRNVALRLHAANKLNVDASGQPLALVARIYKLRQNAAFEQAPLAVFLDPAAEKQALGADLLEVKEITLVPGQHYEVAEKISREAAYVGVVALFHAPAAQRWRLAFAAADAERDGVTVGLHACALSVGSGAKATTADARMLSSVRCQ
jgi:type VI secretion system protein VasD